RAGLHGWFVDGTLGVGGHAELVLRACPGLSLLGIDQDPEILALARERLAEFGERALLRHARASQVPEILETERLPAPVAMLLDLGASSLQLDRPTRRSTSAWIPRGRARRPTGSTTGTSPTSPTCSSTRAASGGRGASRTPS